jgi:hypothetical protein
MPSRPNRNRHTSRISGFEPPGEAAPREAGSAADPIALLRAGAEALRQAGTKAGGWAGAEASQLSEGLRAVANRVFDLEKRRAADRIGLVASVVRQAAGRLQVERLDRLSGYVENVADRIDKASKRVNKATAADVAAAARGVARRHPAWVAGGLLGVGLVIGRLAKTATADAPTGDDNPNPDQLPPPTPLPPANET